MRIFAISDIHVDYQENYSWVDSLSKYDYQNDILILAGDVTDIIPLFEKTLRNLRKRFLEVIFTPGNHDLWTIRYHGKNSLEKLQMIKAITDEQGILMKPFHLPSLSIIPLLGWYDYSFETPSQEIFKTWSDYVACKWPDNYDENRITQYFLTINEQYIPSYNDERFIISFSHFLPRIDIMPRFIPNHKRSLFPVLGTTLLEKQIRKLGSKIHIYGHSHVNNQVEKDNTLYINNAFGYPYETIITSKELKCVYEIYIHSANSI